MLKTSETRLRYFHTKDDIVVEATIGVPMNDGTFRNLLDLMNKHYKDDPNFSIPDLKKQKKTILA